MDESVEAGPSVLDNPLDIKPILGEALRRWFRPDEICKIIQNHEKFGITSEPPDKPQSGSFFLFDRNVQKRFGNDGHNWKKEGHRKLKAGGADNLNCYYARGRENENFQRRRCWILEGAFSHIAFVHYREITVTEEIVPNSENDSSLSSGSRPNNCLEDTCLNSAEPLERVNARSAIPGTDLAPTQSDKGKSDNDAEATFKSSLESIERELSKNDSDQSSSFSFPSTLEEFLNAKFDGVLHFKQPSQNPTESKEKLDEHSSSLGVPISSINLDNQDDGGSEPKAVQNISEISTTASSLGNTSDGLSLIDVEKFAAGKSDPYVHQSCSNCFQGKLLAVPDMDLACIQAGKGICDNDSGLLYESQKHFYPSSWEDILENCTPDMESIPCRAVISSTQSDTMDQSLSNDFLKKQEFGGQPEMQEECQGKSEDFSCVKEAQVAGPYFQGQESVEIMPYSNIDSSMCLGSHPNNCRVLSVSECTDTALLPHGAQALEHEIAQSEYNHQASSGFHFGRELQQPASEQIDAGGSDPKVALFYSNSDPTQLDMGNSDTDAELPHDLWTHHDSTSLEHENAQSAAILEALEAEKTRRNAKLTREEAVDTAFQDEWWKLMAELEASGKFRNMSKKMKEDDEEDEGPDDEGPEGGGSEGGGSEGGPEKDEGPGKEKEEGKKRAPDSALESGKAHKILKAYLACMALLTACYVVHSMETIQMLVLVCVEASKKTGERKLSYIDDGFEPSAIRE